MSSVRDRLVALGVSVPPVPVPLAAYVPAVRCGTLVHTSGQLPTIDGVPLHLGHVGAEVSPEQGAACARLAASNALAAAGSVVDLDAIVRVVSLVGYVASAPGFTAQPAVINGASELLGAVFGDAGGHARSAVGVAELPLGVPVEIALTLEVHS